MGPSPGEAPAYGRQVRGPPAALVGAACPLSYAGLPVLSPWVNTANHPSKRMAFEPGNSLKLDQTLARGRDYGLQLGMDLQLLDDMADVPLDGVRGDAETLGHRGGVQALREQVQDVELSRRELGKELFALPLPRDDTTLPRDRAGEQLDRNLHLAPGRPANGFDDLIRSRILGQVGGGAGVDGIQQGRFGLIGAVEHYRGFRVLPLDHARRLQPGHVRKPDIPQHNVGSVRRR